MIKVPLMTLTVNFTLWNHIFYLSMHVTKLCANLHPSRSRTILQSSHACSSAVSANSNTSHWYYVIRNHIQHGPLRMALVVYKQGRHQGLYDHRLVPLLLKACAALSFLHSGRVLHAESLKVGSYSDVIIGTSLVATYAKCGVLGEAHKVFDEIPERNVVTWNALISGYLRNGDTESASLLFEEMPGQTMVSWNQMIGGFARNGDTGAARRLFDKVPNEFKDVVTWTVMVDGYARKGEMEAAKEIFEQMPVRNCFVWSSMVCGYCKQGSVDQAGAIFRQVPVRSLEIWNSLIAGYVQNGLGEKAMRAFEEMRAEGLFEPDEFTVVSALSACAQLGLLNAGKEIHLMIKIKGLRMNPFVVSGLVDMYAKCGDLVNARFVFEESTEKNIICWNAMISGFATNGKWQEVLEFFGRMEDSNVRPDSITFVAALSACAHGGLVSEASEIVSKMEAYRIQICIRVYGVMVDLLGRAGRLKEAYDLIKRMPMKPNDTVLGAMLSACRIHSDMKMAEQVMEEIGADFVSGENSYNVLLSNIYAASERWEKAERIRRITVDGRSQKIPGCSSIISNNPLGGLGVSAGFQRQLQHGLSAIYREEPLR